MDTTNCLPDAMLVCRNGHVLTDFARSYPDRTLAHCDRCGAETLDRCRTCGQELRGAVAVPGLVPLGQLQPPNYCAGCGARFPWAEPRMSPADAGALATLEDLLRHLPCCIRQLRSRHGVRPPFRVEDEHDLEDLLRALLPLHFDPVRPLSRTPRYALDTRTDFLLPSAGIALAVKRTSLEVREGQLHNQLQEDVAFYERQQPCLTLVGFVYDPQQRLPDPRQCERAWSAGSEELDVRCVIAS
jgi:hypothetical protein